MPEIIVVAHNIRSSLNIGSIFRTCEGLGVKKLILSGYSPYPAKQNDKRLPHISAKADRRIHKTALGAENFLDWQYSDNIYSTIEWLKNSGYTIASLEQSAQSLPLEEFNAPDKIVLLLGSEVSGIPKELLQVSDVILEIKMEGKKESFNVSVAAAMCLYKLLAHK